MEDDRYLGTIFRAGLGLRTLVDEREARISTQYTVRCPFVRRAFVHDFKLSLSNGWGLMARLSRAVSDNIDGHFMERFQVLGNERDSSSVIKSICPTCLPCEL